MFSRNMYDSVARNNDVHDESKCIFVSQSQNNSIYNNTATNCRAREFTFSTTLTITKSMTIQ